MHSYADSAGLSFRVPVLRWTAWSAAAASATEAAAACDIAFVESLLRRRLSPLAKMALHVAHTCVQERPGVRLVFASRHGELNRTMAMLGDLARSEPLSPTAFSLSVHNTAAGIFSIARQDRSAATAVAAGDETLAYGLLESHCQLEANPASAVLMVYADEPLPKEYRSFADRTEHAHAVAILLAAEAPRSVTLACTDSNGTTPSQDPQALAFLTCLAQGNAGSWTGIQRTWTWH